MFPCQRDLFSAQLGKHQGNGIRWLDSCSALITRALFGCDTVSFKRITTSQLSGASRGGSENSTTCRKLGLRSANTSPIQPWLHSSPMNRAQLAQKVPKWCDACATGHSHGPPWISDFGPAQLAKIKILYRNENIFFKENNVFL